MSRISAATVDVVRKRGASAIAVTDTIAPQHLRRVSDMFPSLKVQLPVSERYQEAVYYRSCHLMHIFQRYDDDAASKIQKMSRTVVIQMKNQAFNRKDSISAITFLTDLK